MALPPAVRLRIKQLAEPRVTIQPTGLWLNLPAQDLTGTKDKPWIWMNWDAGTSKLDLWFFKCPVESEDAYHVSTRPSSSAAMIFCPKFIEKWGIYDLAENMGRASFTLESEQKGEEEEDCWVADLSGREDESIN